MAASLRESYAGDDVESTAPAAGIRRAQNWHILQVVEKREAGSERKAPKVVEQQACGVYAHSLFRPTEKIEIL